MFAQPLSHTFRRYRTLQTHRISALPVVILMPHSACNCKCVMCDIWKDNKNLKQLNEADIEGLLGALKKFGTQQVLMSGGEAMLNPNFFRLCEILKRRKMRITVLSTGLTLQRNANQLVQSTDDVIVSLDGDEAVHNRIRNIPGAFAKLKEGVRYVKSLKPAFPVTARTVIHKLNFRSWPAIIDAAKEMGVDQVSFLPADISSNAFNRAIKWDRERQDEVLPSEDELKEMRLIIDYIIDKYARDFKHRFIAESPVKLQQIHTHYTALYGKNAFPYKRCNAPWVSAVIEADGAVRPCFFHESMGNIREQSLDTILNSEAAVHFRKTLDMDANQTCRRCVCYLNLPPRAALS